MFIYSFSFSLRLGGMAATRVAGFRGESCGRPRRFQPQKYVMLESQLDSAFEVVSLHSHSVNCSRIPHTPRTIQRRVSRSITATVTATNALPPVFGCRCRQRSVIHTVAIARRQVWLSPDEWADAQAKDDGGEANRHGWRCGAHKHTAAESSEK